MVVSGGIVRGLRAAYVSESTLVSESEVGSALRTLPMFMATISVSGWLVPNLRRFSDRFSLYTSSASANFA